MAIVNIIGYGIFNLDKIISDPPRSKNARITSISPFEVNVDIELDINDNGVYIPTSISASGLFIPTFNGEISGTVTRVQLKTDDNYWNFEIKDIHGTKQTISIWKPWKPNTCPVETGKSYVFSNEMRIYLVFNKLPIRNILICIVYLEFCKISLNKMIT